VAAGTVVLALVAPAPADAAARPRAGDLRCIDRCAGLRQAAVGATIAFSGHHLARVTRVAFPGSASPVAVAPLDTTPTRVTATVPDGARSGKPRLAKARETGALAKRRLRIVPASRLPDRFELASSSARPRTVFFDGRRPLRLRFRFASAGRSDVRIELAKRRGGVVRAWTKHNLLPYSSHAMTWHGGEADGDPGPEGGYRIRVGPPGGHGSAGGGFRLRQEAFPVAGPHDYGGPIQRFGAPRTGGRTHQGQDVFAACGTPLLAARGGTVQHRAYSDALYGHYLVIDGRGTTADYFYAHMPRPSPLGPGDRVHTGERIGAVGKTGNARTVGCHLHFELWPRGWHHGGPLDPLPRLRHWDRYS
jgi:murein DD-endopeptidase MepM/ murein hydrolase activator NlpD